MSEREIIFAGNPNAGKSTLFNALTHAHAHTGNWHGVTVGPLSKYVKTSSGGVLFTDLPGVYSLNGYSMEEKVAAEYIKAHKNALFVDVIDVRRLSRSLALFHMIADMGASVLIVLTMCKDFQKCGGKLNIDLLSRRLGVPVYAVDSFSKKETTAFFELLRGTSSVERVKGEGASLTLDDIYTPAQRREGRIERICAHPVCCLPIFFLIVAAVFYLTFGANMPGTFLKGCLETLICERLTAFLSSFFPTPAIQSLVCDGILRSAGGVLSFLPQIAILYTFLFFLEESGYMSVLAFSADGVFRKIGLNGRAVFCILLGFGCTAQAILSTRGFDDKGMQRRTISALPYIPCSAKLPVYLTLLSTFFARPFLAVIAFYLLGGAVSILTFAIRAKGAVADGVSEVAQMRLPDIPALIRTIGFRLKQFILKIGTVVAAFTVIVWFVSSFDFHFRYVATENSMLAVCCGGLKYIFYPIGVTDWQTTFALFSGLIAKENVAGLLQLFYPDGLPVSLPTALSLGVFLLFCSPCVSAIAASAREIGWKTSLFNAVWQTTTAVFASYFSYFIFRHILPSVVALFLLVLLLIVKRFCFERIYRKKTRKIKKFHR